MPKIIETTKPINDNKCNQNSNVHGSVLNESFSTTKDTAKPNVARVKVRTR